LPDNEDKMTQLESRIKQKDDQIIEDLKSTIPTTRKLLDPIYNIELVFLMLME